MIRQLVILFITSLCLANSAQGEGSKIWKAFESQLLPLNELTRRLPETPEEAAKVASLIKNFAETAAKTAPELAERAKAALNSSELSKLGQVVSADKALRLLEQAKQMASQGKDPSSLVELASQAMKQAGAFNINELLNELRAKAIQAVDDAALRLVTAAAAISSQTGDLQRRSEALLRTGQQLHAPDLIEISREIVPLGLLPQRQLKNEIVDLRNPFTDDDSVPNR